MKRSALITVYTQVYNTKPYIRQCVESVLNQTYRNFEYYLIDNGSTDGCKEILEEYTAADPRIRLIRHEQNTLPPPGAQFAQDHAAGLYYTVLDADDWWEPDYLERLLSFALENQLDIACAGTMIHVVAAGAECPRKVDRPVIVPRKLFAELFPWYHVFVRTSWGKLVRTKYVQATPLDSLPPIAYGSDTVWAFRTLRLADRIGFDHTILHHYREYNRSLSYQYDPKRFESDIYLYNDAIDFLSAYGPISAQNRNFLQRVYSYAVSDTTDIIQNAALSPTEKLREYRRIAEYPITKTAYRECEHEDAVRSRASLLQRALQAGADLREKSSEDLRVVVQILCPRCGRTVTAANTSLFLENPPLLQALIQDDPDVLLEDLLIQIEKNQGNNKYDIPKMIQALAVENPLLFQINDAAFLRKYGQIYRKVWEKEEFSALDKMTGLLLEDKVDGGQETFLQLYVSLAASLEQASAFIYGKTRQAQFYLRQDRPADCRAILEELTEMGVESDELSNLYRALDDRSC